MFRLLSLSIVLATSLGVSVVAGAATPKPTQVAVMSEGQLTQGSTLRISGGDFGVKSQANPVLFDFASHAFERGELNMVMSSVGHGMLIHEAIESLEDRVWVAMTKNVRINHKDNLRHGHSGSSYLLQGENTWLGRPKAYGGVTGWDTPTDDQQLYVGWWVNMKYDPAKYWRISPSAGVEGTFSPGERVELADDIYGTFIGYDNEGLLNLEIFGEGNSSRLTGLPIVGSESGASTIFPETFREGSGFGYETPGSQKYIRIWEDSSGREGLRYSWTQMHQTVANSTNSPLWVGSSLRGGEWHFLEIQVDSQNAVIRTAINGEWHPEFRFDKSVILDGRLSPTVALIGLNGKVGIFQDVYIDEIYVDNAFNRVLIGNKRTYEESDKFEIQRPLRWSDSEVLVEANLGQFGPQDDLYLYVFNSEGEPNAEGLLLVDGMAPPGRIDLKVQ